MGARGFRPHRRLSDQTIIQSGDVKWDEDMGRQKVWEPEVVERGAPSSGGSRQEGPSGPEIRLEATKKKGEMAEAPASPVGGRALP